MDKAELRRGPSRFTGAVLAVVGAVTLAGCSNSRSPEEKVTDSLKTISDAVAGKNADCADYALGRAKKVYTEAPNDPSTAVDEAYEADQRAATEGVAFIDASVNDCMGSLPSSKVDSATNTITVGGQAFEINYPVFPEQ